MIGLQCHCINEIFVVFQQKKSPEQAANQSGLRSIGGESTFDWLAY
jgi:hypothetical protein